MFSQGFWVNCNFMDVFVQILNVQEYNQDHTILNVIWWNRGQCGKPYIIDPRPQKIKIKRKYYNDWTRLESCPPIEKTKL